MDAGDVVYGAVSTTPIALMSVILQSDPEWVMKYAEEPVVFVEPSTPLMRDKYTLLWQLGASEDALFHEDGWHRLNLNKQAQSLWHSVIELCATVLQSHAMPSDEPLSELVTTQLAQMDALDAQIAAAVGSREASAVVGALVRPNVAIATPDCASLATLKVMAMPALVMDTVNSLQRVTLRECKSIVIRLGNYGICDALSYFDAACFGGGMERAAALGRAVDVALMLCTVELESLAVQADVDFVPPSGCVVPKVDPRGRRSVLARLHSMPKATPGELLLEYTLLQTCGMDELADYLINCSADDVWESGLGNPERFEVLLAASDFLVGLASGEVVLIESTVKAAHYTSELLESLIALKGDRMPWQFANKALSALREVGNYDLSNAWGRVLDAPLSLSDDKLVLSGTGLRGGRGGSSRTVLSDDESEHDGQHDAPVVHDTEGQASPPAPNVCAVCQETCSDSLTDGQLGRLDCCGHEYHFACIRPWVEEQANTCPLCNKTVAKVSRCSTAGVLEEVMICASVDCRQHGHDNGVQAYMAEQEIVESCAVCGAYAPLQMPAFAVVTCAAVVPHALFHSAHMCLRPWRTS